jgi:hypothetical protein
MKPLLIHHLAGKVFSFSGCFLASHPHFIRNAGSDFIVFNFKYRLSLLKWWKQLLHSNEWHFRVLAFD